MNKKDIKQKLTEADAYCTEKGSEFTPLRRDIYELILRRDGPVKAYDLQADMIASGRRAAPTTIYRTLDFLTEQGLIHRINSLNAFVACTDDLHQHEHHDPLMLACSNCEKSVEITDPRIGDFVRKVLKPAGFSFQGNAMEIRGLCKMCQKKDKSSSRHP